MLGGACSFLAGAGRTGLGAVLWMKWWFVDGLSEGSDLWKGCGRPVWVRREVFPGV